jgi:hypothetical protein
MALSRGHGAVEQFVAAALQNESMSASIKASDIAATYQAGLPAKYVVRLASGRQGLDGQLPRPSASSRESVRRAIQCLATEGAVDVDYFNGALFVRKPTGAPHTENVAPPQIRTTAIVAGVIGPPSAPAQLMLALPTTSGSLRFMGTTRHPMVSMTSTDYAGLKSMLARARSDHPWRGLSRMARGNGARVQEQFTLVSPKVVVEVLLAQGVHTGAEYWAGEAHVLQVSSDMKPAMVADHNPRTRGIHAGFSSDPDVRLLPQ